MQFILYFPLSSLLAHSHILLLLSSIAFCSAEKLPLSALSIGVLSPTTQVHPDSPSSLPLGTNIGSRIKSYRKTYCLKFKIILKKFNHIAVYILVSGRIIGKNTPNIRCNQYGIYNKTQMFKWYNYQAKKNTNRLVTLQLYSKTQSRHYSVLWDGKNTEENKDLVQLS